MTGAYIRVKRNDKFENIEIEHLTDDERFEAFKNASSEELVRWINLLSSIVAQLEPVVK